jgi:hypothetical protein
MVRAKTARMRENGSRISFAVTERPSPEVKYSVSG